MSSLGSFHGQLVISPAQWETKAGRTPQFDTGQGVVDNI